MKKINALTSILTILTLCACSKSSDNKATIKTEENKISNYQFVGLDSSDYHYYVGSVNGGVDRSKEFPLSKIFSLDLVMKTLDDSLLLDTSTITNYQIGGKKGQTFPYYSKNDTLFVRYRSDDKKGNPDGIISLKDSSIVICRNAIFIYKDKANTGIAGGLAHDGTGFTSRDVVFNVQNPYWFASEKDMKSTKDIVSWVNLKFIYKLRRK